MAKRPRKSADDDEPSDWQPIIGVGHAESYGPGELSPREKRKLKKKRPIGFVHFPDPETKKRKRKR